MRIIVVPSWFPSPQAPLAGIFFAEQTELLARHAPTIEVHVFAVPRRNFEIPIKRPAAALRVLLGWWRAAKHAARTVTPNYVVHTFETIVWSDRVAHGGLLHEARRMAEVARKIEREGGSIDLVHAHVSHPAGFVAAELARLLGVPLVVSEHMSPFPFDDMRGADGRPFPDVLSPLTSAARVTAVSRAHAASIARYVDRPIDVFPNFIDGTRFAPATHGRGEPFRFLSVGHLVPQKGFDVLLRALAICHAGGDRFHLTIVGTGYEEEALRAIARELDLESSVAWLGAPDRAEMPEVYRGADAFVLASRHESFGVVVIEALASGLPVVATRCGGPEEIVTPECGVLAPPEDPGALAAAMRELARRRFERSAIRGYFESTYAASAVVPRLEALYREVLAAR
ncbi:MAG TPA: glycosyltransferase [Gemmatimonadaceae bacterium]|nr:glycosyltransferase [Gemmatimonadaceae bacterium]